MHNVTILAISRIIKNFMPSVAETGFGGLFYNAREVEFIRTTLDELGQKWQPNPITTDNSTTSGIVIDNIKQQSSKAMDMQFY